MPDSSRGERASVEHVRKALQTVGKGKLLHMYGPSESTVFATYHPVDELEEHTLQSFSDMLNRSPFPAKHNLAKR